MFENQQISVFLENRKGRLAELTQVLEHNKINLKMLTIADTSDFGILRIITQDKKKAVEVLKEARFITDETELLSIEVPDEPGGLSQILKILANNDIGIEYLYSFARENNSRAIIMLKVDNYDKAIKVLNCDNIKILS